MTMSTVRLKPDTTGITVRPKTTGITAETPAIGATTLITPISMPR